LRVRSDNPCADVEGPDRGDTKAKQFLWPAMFLAFARDDRIPISWRRLLALSAYLYVRPEEMAALEWDDVRIEEGFVLVHRAMAMHSTDRGRVKSTKTGTTRRIPIELNLRPLLEAMKEESGGKGAPHSDPVRIAAAPNASALSQAGTRSRGH
jgi:integrase